MARWIERFVKDESGASALEYTLICASMAAMVIAALNILVPDYAAAMAGLHQTMADFIKAQN